MKRISKIVLLSLSIIFLSGCSLPFQSASFPTWKTKGVLEYYYLSDGRAVDGWLGTKIGETVNAKWYDFTVNKVEEVNEYAGRKAADNKKLIHATITIKNTSNKDVYLFDEDFSLIWDLDKSERSHVSSLEAYTDNMLSNELVVEQGQSKTIETVYEIDKDVKKPMALYYYEQYSADQKGNKYYVYID